MKSKYIVFPQKREAAVWEEEIAPPAEGHILCAAEKSLISIGTEMNCFRGEAEPGTNWFDWLKFPFRPGYSMVGRVIAVGNGVTGFKEGDRVATYDVHQQYYDIQVQDVKTRFDIPVGFQIYRLPDTVSSEDATWRSLAVTTQNALRRADFKFGESVGVVGLGILGQLVTQYLAAAGAKTIVVIDPVKSRLDLAKAHGATHALQMDVKDAEAVVSDLTGGRMLDVVFDITGQPAVIASCIGLVRRLGRLLLLGDTPNPSQQHLAPGVVFKSISILGLHGYAIPERTTDFTPWTVETMSSLFFNYLERGKMNVADLVTHRFSPLEAPMVYQNLFKDRSADIGVIFDWTLLKSVR